MISFGFGKPVRSCGLIPLLRGNQRKKTQRLIRLVSVCGYSSSTSWMKINSFYTEPKCLQMGTAFEFSALFKGKMLYYRLVKPQAMYSSIEFKNIFPLVDAALWPLTKARCLQSSELTRQPSPTLACTACFPLPVQ